MKKKELKRDWVLCTTCYRLSLKGHEKCPFCGEKFEEITNSHLITEKQNYQFEQITNLGIIMIVISLVLLFISPAMAFVFSLVSISLIVLGKTKKNEKYYLFSSVMILLSTSAFIMGIFLLSDSSSLTYTQMIKRQINASIFEQLNDENRNLIFNKWFEESGINYLILKDDHTYEWYSNKNNLDDSYTKGVFEITNGAVLYGQRIYDDGEYYHYQLTLTKFQVKEPLSIKGITDQKQEEYFFTLKKDGKRICLENISTKRKQCFLNDISLNI